MSDNKNVKITIEAETKKATRSVKGLAKALAGMVSVAVARQFAKITLELFKLGASFDQLKTSLDAITIGRADEFLEAVGKASRGTISEVDALAISARALQLGAVGSADEMERMTTVAIALGRVVGLDAKTAVSDFSLAIGRESKLILDNLGLTIDLNLRKAEAARLMRENSSLTEDAAMKQAFLNEALRLGEETLAKMNTEVRTSAEELLAFQANITNAKVATGEWINEALLPLLEVLNDDIDAMEETAKATQELAPELLRAGHNAQEFNTALNESNDATRRMVKQQLTLLIAEKEGIELKEAYTIATRMLKNERIAAFDLLTEGQRKTDELAEAERLATIRARGLAFGAELAASKIEEVGEEAEGAADKVNALNRAIMNAVNDAVSKNRSGALSVEGIFGDLAGGENAATDSLQGLASVQTDELDERDLSLIVLAQLKRAGAPILVIWEYRKAAGLATAAEIERERALMLLVEAAARGDISATELFNLQDDVESGAFGVSDAQDVAGVGSGGGNEFDFGGGTQSGGSANGAGELAGLSGAPPVRIEIVMNDGLGEVISIVQEENQGGSTGGSTPPPNLKIRRGVN